MKKIRLNADALQVASFATAPMAGLRGTVDGAVTGIPCYPHSFYHEYSCTCEDVPPSQDLRCQPDTGPVRCAPLDTVDVTCMTCPGQPGC